MLVFLWLVVTLLLARDNSRVSVKVGDDLDGSSRAPLIWGACVSAFFAPICYAMPGQDSESLAIIVWGAQGVVTAASLGFAFAARPAKPRAAPPEYWPVVFLGSLILGQASLPLVGFLAGPLTLAG